MTFSSWWRRPVSRSIILIGAMAVLTVGGQLAMPRTPPAASTVVVPISSLSLVCPTLPADSPGLSIAVKGALLAGAHSASLQLQARQPVNLNITAHGVTSTAVRHSAAAVFSASGSAASQLMADASIAGSSSTTRGYATYSCQPPTSSQWLVGGASTVGRTDVLSIANVDDTTADVDLEVWSESGKSSARSLHGIEIPPRSVKQISLAQLEPDRAMFAVHVTANGGQVTSAILSRGQRALSSLGIDVISPVSSPLASALVGVIPNGTTNAVLGLLSPGSPTAARVSLVTSDGVYPLAGAENLTLDADKLLRIPLPDAALVGDVMVLVQADAEILSGITSDIAIKGGPDLASEAMLSPIYRAASVTVDPTVSEATALLYSDVATTVTARVRTGSNTTTQRLRLKAGVVTRAKLVGGAGQPHLLSILPDVDGVVSGSVLFTRASVGMAASSVEPLVSVRGYVAVPPVEPDVSR
ncbi:MAG: DUF5719 family protein [Candidatus Nanopelagicales bacterium]